MRRFQLLLFFRSFRWVAPALVLFTWLVNLLTTGTGFALASSLFPAFLLWSLWATIALGNMHDKPTRDLLAATVGSSARFHSSIWSTVAVVSLPLIAVVGVLRRRNGRRAKSWRWGVPISDLCNSDRLGIG